MTTTEIDLDVLLETPGAILDVTNKPMGFEDTEVALMYAQDPYAEQRPNYQGIQCRCKELFLMQGPFLYSTDAQGQSTLSMEQDLPLRLPNVDILRSIHVTVLGLEEDPNIKVDIYLEDGYRQQAPIALTLLEESKFAIPACLLGVTKPLKLRVVMAGLREEAVLSGRLAIKAECHVVSLLRCMLTSRHRIFWTVGGQRYMSENGIVARMPRLELTLEERAILQGAIADRPLLE